MADRKIQSDDILLFIDPEGGTSYDTLICLTSNGFDLSTDIVDSSSKCGPDSSPGNVTQNVTFEGQVVVDPSSGKITSADLFTLCQNKTTIGWKMGPASPAPGDVTRSGTGFIASLSESYQHGSPTSFSGSIGPFGNITQTIEPEPEP